MGSGYHNGEICLEVANLDTSDAELEIVIMYAEKIIALDLNGNPKFTIALSEVTTQ